MDLKPHKILKYVDTRWLSMEQCVKRLIERKKELIQFLREYDEKKSEKTRLSIINRLEDSEIIVFLEFLSLFLELINTLNIYFQQKDSCISEILPKTTEFLIIMTNLVIQPEYRKCSLEEKLDKIKYNRDLKFVLITIISDLKMNSTQI